MHGPRILEGGAGRDIYMCDWYNMLHALCRACSHHIGGLHVGMSPQENFANLVNLVASNFE